MARDSAKELAVGDRLALWAPAPFGSTALALVWVGALASNPMESLVGREMMAVIQAKDLIGAGADLRP